jgi:hypothetical protein
MLADNGPEASLRHLPDPVLDDKYLLTNVEKIVLKTLIIIRF